MTSFKAQESDDYLTQKRKEWVGKELGDYVVVDVIKDLYGGKVIPLLVVKCKVCGVQKKTTFQTFERSKNIHGPFCVPMRNWDEKLKALKDKYLGETYGQFTCFDVLKKWNKSMNCCSPVILAECKICGDKKEFTIRDFTENENRHEKICSVLNDFRSYVGKQIEDQHILNYVRKGNTAFYNVKCEKCGRTYDIACQKFFQRASQTHEHLCVKPLGTPRFRVIWSGMIQRCTNPNNSDYSNYGGRGICITWKSFNDFYNDMYESYMRLANRIGEENVSIERINVDGDYSKVNCRWIHVLDQKNNLRRTVYFRLRSPLGHEYYGKNINAFCLSWGLSAPHIKQVLDGQRSHHKGWVGRRITPEEYDVYCESHKTQFNDMIWKFMNEKYDERINTRVQDVFPEGLRITLMEVSSNCNIYLWDELIENIELAENPYGLDISYDRKRKCFFLKKAKDFISEESVG